MTAAAAHSVTALEPAPGGVKIVCDCGYVTQVLVVIGPEAPETTELAITCGGCRTSYWAVLTLRKQRPEETH